MTNNNKKIFVICISIFITLIFIYMSSSVLDNKTEPSEPPIEPFTQIKHDLSELKKMIGMYASSMLKPPINKEEKCLSLNGHIGSVINRAIGFCG